jgi:hypothetical protein
MPNGKPAAQKAERNKRQHGPAESGRLRDPNHRTAEDQRQNPENRKPYGSAYEIEG